MENKSKKEVYLEKCRAFEEVRSALRTNIMSASHLYELEEKVKDAEEELHTAFFEMAEELR